MDKENINCPVDKYLANIRLFEQLSQPCEWVFLGDSITNAGRWSELFVNKKIHNHGIDGDTVKGMLGRVELVLNSTPEVVFLLGGINDITQDRTPATIMESYTELVSTLSTKGIKVVLQSTILTNNSEWNRNVIELNKLIENFAKEEGLTFIDLNEIFSEGKEIKGESTFDGVHLQGDMYILWKDKLIAEAL
ncbi:GDSL-type esterase/lipase family protein [Vibrio owensii]|uniref:GDSL-type esterase/lipase family protein n=1 Tax=Vibrio owensii TaxID=696485 RepID=UPI0040680B59